MNKFYTILFLITIIINNIYAQDEVAKDILDQLSEKTQTYSDITIEFSHNFSNDEQEINENLTGQIVIKGDMYKLDMSNELSVINNGKTQWIVMKDIPEVQIMNNDPEDEWNPSKIFTIYEKGYKYEYLGEESINGRKAKSIHLYPEESGSISKIVLLIDAEKIEIINIIKYDKDGGIETYTITKFTTDSSISENLFKFIKEDYPEVEIIDLR